MNLPMTCLNMKTMDRAMSPYLQVLSVPSPAPALDRAPAPASAPRHLKRLMTQQKRRKKLGTLK